MSQHDYDFGVSLSEIGDMEGFAPIPPGDYQVKAEQVGLKNAKSGNGKYLAFEFSVVDGPYKNRRIFQNVIVEHTNEDARHIGLRWLKSWILACNGTGNEQLTLSLVLRHLNHPCIGCISIEEGQSGYSDQNKIQKFKTPNHDIEDAKVPF